MLCGGFGVVFNDVSDPSDPKDWGRTSDRCQRVTAGAMLDNGNQVFYLAHHGDAWVELPSIKTYQIRPNGGVDEIAVLEDPTLLFEGLAWGAEHLFVADHSGGLRVYGTDLQGVPSFVTRLEGFDNAIKLALSGDMLYVADGTGGLKVVNVADPTQPSIVGSAGVPGNARDVAVLDGMAYVALGGEGVDVFDVSAPASPVLQGHVKILGQAQAVAVEGDVLAVAAWNHVAVYDRETLVLLGTEHVRPSPSFEQNFGITMKDGLIYVAEWERLHILEYRPGFVDADIWLERELFAFDPALPDTKVMLVRNRGYLDLDVTQIELPPDAPFYVDQGSLRVTARSANVLEVGYQLGAGSLDLADLDLHSNDPDATQTPMRATLTASFSDLIDVGDRLPETFGFLDVGGVGDVNALEGKVIVLAYFALF